MHGRVNYGMKKRLSTIWFIMMIFCVFVAQLNSNSFRAFTVCRHASTGIPYRYTNRFSGAAALTDYCIKDGYAYLLFEGTGVLKVYDLSGRYLHSFAFYTMTAGSSILHTDSSFVFLEDQFHNIYSFLDGEFMTFYERNSDNCPKLFNDNQKRISSDGVQYKKSWGSIIAVTPEGSKKTIVSRPFFLVFTDYYPISYALLFYPVFAAGVISHVKRRKTV